METDLKAREEKAMVELQALLGKYNLESFHL